MSQNDHIICNLTQFQFIHFLTLSWFRGEVNFPYWLCRQVGDQLQYYIVRFSDSFSNVFLTCIIWLYGGQVTLSTYYVPRLWSDFRNRHPPENKTMTSGTYRQTYPQYDLYQQNSYTGYYPNWGYDTNGDSYGYNYSQYYPQSSTEPQVYSQWSSDVCGICFISS